MSDPYRKNSVPVKKTITDVELYFDDRLIVATSFEEDTQSLFDINADGYHRSELRSSNKVAREWVDTCIQKGRFNISGKYYLLNSVTSVEFVDREI